MNGSLRRILRRRSTLRPSPRPGPGARWAARLSLPAALLAGAAILALGPAGPASAAPADRSQQPAPTSEQLRKPVLVGADMWERRPRMLAAGLGFTDIIGVDGMNGDDLAASEAAVRAAGGAWNSSLTCEAAPALGDYTSAASPNAVAFSYGFPVHGDAGLPVEFSWPVLPSTLGAADFRVTLTDGSVVMPDAAAVFPNFEYNERSTVVLFGKFGNRQPTGDPRSNYPRRIEVVKDDSPLRLVGKRGRRVVTVSAVGMSASPTASPYDDPGAAPADRTGPRLAAAKLTRMSRSGESAPPAFRTSLPNDGRALYGPRARFRLRMLTTGGFSPDGVLGVKPTEFERYFQIVARAPGGRRVVIRKVGKTYRIGRGWLRVVGLADLGLRQDSYDDCYDEDHDNQIDVILNGDRKGRAAARVRTLRIPASGGYDPFYNPGGPGSDPTPGVAYTSPGPTVSQRVTIALRDPLTVTYRRPAR